MIINNPDVFRANVKKQLSIILNNPSHGDNLERGIYNYTLQQAEKNFNFENTIINFNF